MNLSTHFRTALALLAFTQSIAAQSTTEQAATGLQTESRFPPLVVPAGFKATLFACDPLIEYPSVIALGPRFGSVYAAYDYMTGLGTEIIRRDEIRLVEDSDGDGYADKSTLFADGFNSLQGLAYHAGTVYAMHAPLLTSLRDTDGDGKADERRDLLTGLGLTPEQNQTRLHCANGVVVGHDGWLYLAMGDNGTNVLRPEGDRLVLNGGGILRCRPDGRDLHVFSTGLRNIYDIALDEELNVFVRDNENDGGDYMIRVYHSFFGADHGYPYLYYEHPDEALAPLADLGRGSSAGMVCYLETAFPEEYRGNLFCCEWGKSIVRYERKRAGSSFAPMKEIEFATGAAGDPYGFKPTDIIVDYDGSLLVSDWCDGQRPKRGRGRIYRIAYVGEKDQKPGLSEGPVSRHDPTPAKPTETASALKQLDSPSYHARVAAQEFLQSDNRRAVLRKAIEKQELPLRAQLHAVWILASAGSDQALSDLTTWNRATSSSMDPRVGLQMVRSLADLRDPVLARHRLDGRGDTEKMQFLYFVFSARADDPPLFREMVVALARLPSPRPLGWFQRNLERAPDAAMSHAVQQFLRRNDDWPSVLKLLDEPDDQPMRAVALRALTDHPEASIVDDLIARLQTDARPEHRCQYAELLTRVYKQPGPWTYWGYRPPPRPANTVAWERTEAIAAALDRVLADADRDVRTTILKRMQRESIPVRVATLESWLKDERSAQRVATILNALSHSSADESRGVLTTIIQDPTFAIDNRTAALSQFVAGLTDANEQQLLSVADRIEDGPLMVKALAELSRRPKVDSRALLIRKLDSSTADVRAAALSACSLLKVSDAASRVPMCLQDADNGVRRAAAVAAGAFAVKVTTSALLKLTGDDDPTIRSASLDALRRLREPGAVTTAVKALDHSITQLAAIEYLTEFGTPEHTGAVTTAAASNRSMDILSAVARALANWESREPSESPRRAELQSSLANVQGQCGVVLGWHVVGALDTDAARKIREQLSLPPVVPTGSQWHIASSADGRIELPSPRESSSMAAWLAVAEFSVADATRAQFLAGSNGAFQVWLNGRSVYHREKAVAYQPDSDRFEVELAKGMNRVVVELGTPKEIESALFHLRFRPLSSSAAHERITQYLLQNSGNVDRGRELFLNADKTLCIKCHKLGDQGGVIGPNLTGVGSRFARIHLIESILEPSRTIAPSYDTISVALNSGRVITGVKVAEDETTLILGDDTGKRHEIPKSDIDERVPQRRSTMPEGLEKRFTDREFLDLMTFLVAEKKVEPR